MPSASLRSIRWLVKRSVALPVGVLSGEAFFTAGSGDLPPPPPLGLEGGAEAAADGGQQRRGTEGKKTSARDKVRRTPHPWVSAGVSRVDIFLFTIVRVEQCRLPSTVAGDIALAPYVINQRGSVLLMVPVANIVPLLLPGASHTGAIEGPLLQ